jgi:hypothetical protein
MSRRKWLWAALLVLPLAGAGVVYGHTLTKQQEQPAAAEPYICPVTGEELPCPQCCPLNQQQ